jgi:arabinan endo-1,5-alpha-L-arabinosidase
VLPHYVRVTVSYARTHAAHYIAALGLGVLASPSIVTCTPQSDVVAVYVASGGTGGTSSTGGAPTTVTGGSAGENMASAGQAGAGSGPPSMLTLSGDLETHDSTLLEANGTYYLYHSGPGLLIKTSPDLLTWESVGSAFPAHPSWIEETVPGVTALWAPDLSQFGGTFHLYYAASTFGSGRSCIGHATKAALDSSEPWQDQGSLICSNVDAEVDWDAIDPATFRDEAGTRWMVFGSFGSGIKLIRLNAAGARADAELYSIAARPEVAAVQAPFIVRRAPYYYLFVSFDSCCQGTASTYNIRVGRAESVTGPYLDRDGTPMLEGGGTLVLGGTERWPGVGANIVFSANGRDYNLFHAYDANAAGRATLRIAELDWDEDGWPVSAGP